MNGKIVPVQIRLPVELVNTIDEYLQEKGTQAVLILFTEDYPDDRAQQSSPYYQ
jgi:hypothetical protein